MEIMKIIMKNEAGMVKEVKKGFSWTTFFFGVFVPLLRGDLKWAAILFFTGLLLGIVSGGILTWIPGMVMSFMYNKLYMKDLYEKGYRPVEDGLQDMVLNYVNS